MKQKSLLTLLITLFNRLMVAGYHTIQRKRGCPFSIVDFVTYSGSRESFGLQQLAPWRATIALDKRIDRLIAEYGIKEYQTISLYDLPSHVLDDALMLIPLGFVEPDDFKSDKPISRIFQKDEFLTSKENTKFLDKWLHNNDVKNAARGLANTKKEYNDHWFSIARYKASIDINRYFTAKIEECEKQFGNIVYLSQSLYGITEEELFFEAAKAIREMWLTAESWFVVSYNGESVYNLSLFAVRKCRAQLAAGDSTGVVFDEARKQQKEDENKRDDEEDEVKREKRNAAARERRAKKKARLLL